MRVSLERAFLSGSSGVQEIHDFESAQQFLSESPINSPAVLVLDMSMPGMTGLQLQEALLDRGKNIPIVFISGDSEKSDIIQGLKNGASDFLLKPFPLSQLLEAVNKALNLEFEKEKAQGSQKAALEAYALLTYREREVFALLARGKMSKDVAEELGITPATVKIFKANVMKKLGIESIADLVQMAINHNLLTKHKS
jgi:FixJ family two-component response regulator